MEHRRDLTHDLFLPTILFVALGAFSWAVRGSSGYGASAGCIFAGVTLGTAWWYLARDPSAKQSRRYTSAWIIPAMVVGFGIAGNCGWMQWPSFFAGRLCLDAPTHQYVPISRSYGFLWLFLAGVPWAGLGACFLAWTGARRPTAGWEWLGRIAFGLGGAYLLGYLIYFHNLDFFVPLYDTLKDKYAQPKVYHQLAKLIRDNHECMRGMGFLLGFVTFEIIRRDWKNVLLIVTVGLLNGIGWSLCQNWHFHETLWPHADFNFWRCWETSGGVCIGFAYGIAYFLTNRKMSEAEAAACASKKTTGFPDLLSLIAYLVAMPILAWMATEVMPVWLAYTVTAIGFVFGLIFYFWTQQASLSDGATNLDDAPAEDPNLERWGGYLGLIFGLGLSIKNGLKGYANVYYGNEDYWNQVFWHYVSVVMIVLMVGVALRILFQPRRRDRSGDVFPYAYGIIWLVIVVQNILGQMITGPYTDWKQVVYDIYYFLLFLITTSVLLQFRFLKELYRERHANP